MKNVLLIVMIVLVSVSIAFVELKIFDKKFTAAKETSETTDACKKPISNDLCWGMSTEKVFSILNLKSEQLSVIDYMSLDYHIGSVLDPNIMKVSAMFKYINKLTMRELSIKYYSNAQVKFL